MITTLARTQEADIIVLFRKILRSAVTIRLPAGLDWMNLDETVRRKWLRRENVKTTRRFIVVVFIPKPRQQLIKSSLASLRESKAELL